MVLLPNGSDAHSGTLTSDGECSGQWKKINDEAERGAIDLETTVRATCPPENLGGTRC